ncbi:MAG: alkaline phosphatase family protein [Bacteriovoracaceae bacterium]|nr:alkaline phosphatase family protein [Bacteriovoracaceae bacterium]
MPLSMRFTKRNFLKALVALPIGLRCPQADVGLRGEHLTSFTKAMGRFQDLRLCFGSCNYQDHSQDYWKKIAKRRADLWFWLGDNIYGDTRDVTVLENKYKQLLGSPYGEFRKNIEIDGIWDDHDFGEDAADGSYPHKIVSQKLHLDFLDVPESDDRRKREGIYHSREDLNGTIKTYFLDTRYFKSTEKGEGEDLLGEDQWRWLEAEMAASKAKVNIIITPIGMLLNRLFVTEDWAEFPDDKNRLLALVAKYNLSGVFFMSGDKHFGAFIKRSWQRNGEEVDYFEFQSSGLTHVAPKSQLKIVRKFYGKRNTITDKNFGQIDFYQEGKYFFMVWTLFSLEGHRRLTRVFYLDRAGVWQRP